MIGCTKIFSFVQFGCIVCKEIQHKIQLMVGKRIVGYLFFACFSLAESKDDTVTVKESPTQPAVVPTQKYNFGCKTRLIQAYVLCSQSSKVQYVFAVA